MYSEYFLSIWGFWSCTCAFEKQFCRTNVLVMAGESDSYRTRCRPSLLTAKVECICNGIEIVLCKLSSKLSVNAPLFFSASRQSTLRYPVVNSTPDSWRIRPRCEPIYTRQNCVQPRPLLLLSFWLVDKKITAEKKMNRRPAKRSGLKLRHGWLFWPAVCFYSFGFFSKFLLFLSKESSVV